ncbi:MAG: hypothetical protein ACHQ4F_13780 [Candidatus Dormibacteria bacterium]
MKSRFLSVLAGAVVILVVGACGAEASPPWLVRHYLGLPPGVTLSPQRVRDNALWLTAGQMAVLTWGSSGCPGLPSRLKVTGGNALTVMVTADVPPDGASCPADLAATASVIQVPTALDVSEQVNVTIVDGSFGATVPLPPRPVSDN